MSEGQACRGSPHGPIEKEMCHLTAEKNESFWMFTEPDTHGFTVLFAYVYVFSFYSVTPLCSYYIYVPNL